VLVTFLGCTGVLLDRAFRDSAMQSVEDRLRGRVFLLIGAADFDAVSPTALVRSLPDPSLASPASGHYARISSPSGDVLWSSLSLLGVEIRALAMAPSGEWHLERVRSSAGEHLFAMSYGIIWEGVGDREPREFNIQAYEVESLYLQTLRRFRRSLWFWFAGLSGALLLVQALNLSWGLRPLSQVGEEVRAIEHGEREQIVGSYPSELTTLTRNLNKLLKHNRDGLKRYRNSLGDLAHAVKTPLAVLRNELEAPANISDKHAALEQIARIDRTVQYYLQRSAAAGHSLLAPPLAVAPVAERIVASMRKVHAQRQLRIQCEVADDLMFPADEGDLIEIIGNLTDNACKWAARDVALRISSAPTGAADNQRLLILVHDDGPGIPAAQIELLTRRGTRLDESVEGHGIGLAIVREMVEDVYGGRLVLESGPQGTVARVEMVTS